MGNKSIQVLAEKIESNKPVALVMITNTEGPSPRGTGSMMVVDREGRLLEGSIGGGMLEEKVKNVAADYIKRGISGRVGYVLDREARGGNQLDMTCGGNVEVFIRVFNSSERIVIAGCGHIAQALYLLATVIGYQVTIIDDRKEMMTRDRFPEAELLAGDIPSILQEYSINEKTSIVIVTHGHRHDEAALEAVIHSPARYIGMIGSLKKIEICFDNLAKRGVDRLALKRVCAPIGLDLGGEQPREIALAIMAEIQAVKYGKKGGMLSAAK